ncbi:NAD(P)/FAD-dependent oxidoreductase [Streptomyces sp. SAJ15]|uniref:flavin-containing monooxygenase n=1 Tax=Streptomyces sp. SAJ15 TaxID=2011095 RepID=UPI0021B22ADC|nr:NAD(P)/FAD-dependent oxidoreductase [Streptomyces sp. SAJ15]
MGELTPAHADELTPGHVRVAVIGSGFGGLGAAVRLRREGITDFVVLERAGSVGGTWRDNTYPGCACDVPSHLYSFSFAPNPGWPRNFSGQPHIRAYLERVADTFGLRPHLRFHTEVRALRWDTEALRWEVGTSRGTLTADMVVSAAGPLSDPRIPDIPGLDTFPGAVFHSARWDHEVDLRGKRVAMVGTGASAIQIVPAIQPEVARLALFQRTPAWVLPRADRRISEVEQWLHAKVPVTGTLRRGLLWGMRELQVSAFTKRPRQLGFVERLAQRNMARSIKDPELRARLTPSYRIGCKRILLSNDYYPALSRPNVRLIASGLAEVRGSTLVAADGTTTEADALIFGTGFRITDMPLAERVTGARGTTLAEEWRDTGMRALRGGSIAGFPNFMMIIGPNTGLGNSSMILMIEAQLNYLADYMRQLDRLGGGPRGRAALDARESAVDAWAAGLQRRMGRTVWNTGGCTSWYLDAEGRNTTVWPGTTGEFRRVTRRVDLAEYEVLRGRDGAPSRTETVPATRHATAGDGGGAGGGDGTDAPRTDADRAVAGRADAGRAGAGGADAGRAVPGDADAGHTDAGRADAARTDAGRVDAGRADAGDVDAGREDAGDADAGGTDAGRAGAAEVAA